MEIYPLDGPFGRNVTGIDLTTANEATLGLLMELLYEHAVLLIRGQHLTKSQFHAFGRRLGKLRDFSSLFQGRDHDPQFPEMFVINNSPAIPAPARDAAAYWHSDGSYDRTPDSTTMLYVIESPDQGGETRFANLAAAYDALPEEIRVRIDQLDVVHHINGAKRAEEEKIISEEGRSSEHSLSSTMKHVHAVHPLVLRHQATGRKGLYAVAGTPIYIPSLSRDQSDTLLDFLKKHALQPCFRLSVKAEANDLLLWDNRQTLHSATPLEHSAERGKRRHILRLCINGMPVLIPAQTATVHN